MVIYLTKTYDSSYYKITISGPCPAVEAPSGRAAGPGQVPRRWPLLQRPSAERRRDVAIRHVSGGPRRDAKNDHGLMMGFYWDDNDC